MFLTVCCCACARLAPNKTVATPIDPARTAAIVVIVCSSKVRSFCSARSTELCNARAASDLHNFADVDRPNECVRRTAGTRAHMMAGGYTRDVVALPSLRSLPSFDVPAELESLAGPPIPEFGSGAIRTVRKTGQPE